MVAAQPDDNSHRETITLDSDISSFVDATAASSILDLDAMPVDEALALVRPEPRGDTPPPGSEDRWIDVGSGRKIRIRLYYPDDCSQNLPALMYLHGGGFVGGTVEMDDARCRTLANEARCLVVSVDYPLAPENPFPEPIEAAFAIWKWLGASAAGLGIDPHRMAVSGSSAGGHLAIGVCLLSREREAPRPVLQLLTYPVVDPSLESNSYRAFAAGPFLTRARMAWYWNQYLGTRKPEGELWSPLSGSLAGLPPALVITAQYDVLRDEGEAYASALGKAGVAVTVYRHPGMIHGFLAVMPHHKESIAALAECVTALSNAFAGAKQGLGKGNCE